jgi:hypothetical protein
MSSKASWLLSPEEMADFKADARGSARASELERVARPGPPASPAEGLRQLWDLLDLLGAMAGPLPPERNVITGVFLI